MLASIIAASAALATPMPIPLDPDFVVCVSRVERLRGPAQRVVITIDRLGEPPRTNTIRLPKGRVNILEDLSFPAAGPSQTPSSFTVEGQYLGRDRRWRKAFVREIARNDQHFEFWYDSVRDTGSPAFGSLKLDLVRSQRACPGVRR